MPNSRSSESWTLLGGTIGVVFLVLAVGLAWSGDAAGSDDVPAATMPAQMSERADYVADSVCATCHAAETEAWSDSHHAHAMEPPTEDTVRGDFDDVTFESPSGHYRFFRRDGGYFVETEGPDGKTATFEVAYTFGWTPLQQYLVALDRGRLQALSVAWDTERKRWFDLAEEPVAPGDALHWTGREYNWNFRCADCHSTDLRRNYDLETDSYETTYSAVNVGCQGCHGPGSAHVAWAEENPAGGDYGPGTDIGLVTDLKAGNQIGTCAQCHSRRRQITDHNVAGEPFLDHYTPSLLQGGLYFPDGQIDDEVYVYGSFLQSRMNAKGVVCTDCHEPHSGALLADGNAVCTACHSETPPERFSSIRPLAYDSPAHHFHDEGKPGSFCVDCHMPERTYMVVDPRRDHSFRIPRPDLAAMTGAPDACTGCHSDKAASWAADRIAEWYGPDRRNEPHFGETLALGRSGAPGAGERLAALATDRDQPAIARATAVEMLRAYLDEVTGPSVVASLEDPDPMVRAAALESLEGIQPDARVDLAAPLLDDPVRSVRIMAARVLAPVPAETFLGDRRGAYQAAVDEYVASELAAAERPESHLNLGGYWAERGDAGKAEAAYRTALRLAPDFIPAMINLAELQRALGNTSEEATLLERAYLAEPDNAAVVHALGLLRVRQGRREDALPLLAEAVEQAPESARYAHVYAVALESLGNPQAAREVRETALENHPYDVDLLAGLLRDQLNAGDRDGARDTVDRLLALRPQDAELARLKAQLDAR
ncbi:tetratricopeptide repeat protein [Microbaculum sp. FT89]|uniref:tetratricopeptide repeat protein n=1 Tax=Microbaculum sp. FT89 TaxID=3447298 RepID=UPI003F53705D